MCSDCGKESMDVVTVKVEGRPDWDHYFMNIAEVAATRSNCSRRHVAAVLVRDKRVISTGYNGTPRGIKNCNEGGSTLNLKANLEYFLRI